MSLATLTDGRDSDEDDTPQLSEHALAALKEFYTEQQALQQFLDKADDTNPNSTEETQTTAETSNILFQNDLTKSFPEDWQLSQFWYNEETSRLLAKEVLNQTDGKIACVSCPSIFRACENAPNVHLFEYDRRFRAFGSLYHFYDYNEPEAVPETCESAFSLVIADPPFLSEECMEKVALTVKKLLQPEGKIILCTGAVMEDTAKCVLNLKRSSFVPRHKNQLGNEFACFTNYDLSIAKQV